jgi:hypothetical protein
MLSPPYFFNEPATENARIKNMTAGIKKITNKTWAIPRADPATPVKPNIPATMDTIKNKIDHLNIITSLII